MDLAHGAAGQSPNGSTPNRHVYPRAGRHRAGWGALGFYGETQQAGLRLEVKARSRQSSPRPAMAVIKPAGHGPTSAAGTSHRLQRHRGRIGELRHGVGPGAGGGIDDDRRAVAAWVGVCASQSLLCRLVAQQSLAQGKLGAPGCVRRKKAPDGRSTKTMSRNQSTKAGNAFAGQHGHARQSSVGARFSSMFRRGGRSASARKGPTSVSGRRRRGTASRGKRSSTQPSRLLVGGVERMAGAWISGNDGVGLSCRSVRTAPPNDRSE
jgi:hypothetical protein